MKLKNNKSCRGVILGEWKNEKSQPYLDSDVVLNQLREQLSGRTPRDAKTDGDKYHEDGRTLSGIHFITFRQTRKL